LQNDNQQKGAHVAGSSSRSRSRTQEKKRRQPVSVEEIAETALRVLDGEGLEGLTMRRLAGEIGVQPMTLYRYLPDKEAILAVVADLLWERLVDIPEGETWRERVRAGWLNMHGLMQEHPYATPLIARAGTYSANAITGTARMVEILRDAGFSPELASEVMHTLGATVVGFAFASLWLRQSEEGRRPDAPAGEIPTLSADLVAYKRNVGPSEPRQFEGALDMLLEGFQQRLEGERGAARP
jgi:AcrR family transcriptional regulator